MRKLKKKIKRTDNKVHLYDGEGCIIIKISNCK